MIKSLKRYTGCFNLQRNQKKTTNIFKERRITMDTTSEVEKSPSPSSSPKVKRQKFSKDIHFEAVLPDDLINEIPLIDVYVASITDPKNISKVIIELNRKLPVPELQHLKRIRAREVLICPCSWTESILTYLSSKEVNADFIDVGNVKVAQAASLPPKTKRQYLDVNKIWPCNFHSNKYIEKLVENSLFTPKELELHTTFIKLAMKLSTEKGTKCGVIITDPLRNDLIIAGGYSMIADNPILHATMVAIDGVARTQNGGAYNHMGIDCKWPTLLSEEFHELKVLQRQKMEIVDDKNHIHEELNDSEYLCTNYHVYMTHEPCTMCAMALIHSRAKRVFYLYPSDNGALGTLCKIHTVKDLNHHYEVFRVVREDLDAFATNIAS